MRIGVVGAGTAGCAACLFFTRAGHDVTLLERVPEPVGAGILLQPTGMAVLHELGLLDPLLARGARVSRLHGVTVRGHTVMDLALPQPVGSKNSRGPPVVEVEQPSEAFPAVDRSG